MADIDVEIANMATGFFGEDDRIADPDEDSKPARTVRAAWASTRQFVRSKANWSCGRRRSELNARTVNAAFPIIGFSYAFPLPDRFVRLVRILEPALAIEDYLIQRGPSSREILADTLGPLTIEWQEDVIDPVLWSPEFRETFTYRLAWQVADRLSGDKERKEQAHAAYREGLSLARGSDARQQPPQAFVDGDWTRARRDGDDRALTWGWH